MTRGWQWLGSLVVALLAACGGGGGGGSDGGGGGGGGTPPPVVVAANRVVVTASGPPTLVPSGGSAELTITLANPSADVAHNVFATLVPGTGLTRAGAVVCSASGGAACPATPETLALASLPAGGGLVFRVPVMVAPGSSGAITSTVAVNADNELAGADNGAQVQLQTYSADVRVAGSAATTWVASGRTTSYTMTVVNAGPDPALDVVLQNAVDATQALGPIACVAAGGATCPATGATMNVPVLAVGGELTFTVAATLAPAATGTVGNTLHASLAGDPSSADNVATASTIAVAPTGRPTAVLLQSDAGEFVGDGYAYAYSLSTAEISADPNSGLLQLHVRGDQNWDMALRAPGNPTQVLTGTHFDVPRFGTEAPVVGGFSWTGEGRGCNTSLSAFAIDSAVYTAGILTSFDLRFEQHCEGLTPALLGAIHWDLTDSTAPPGPVNPAPGALWRAPAGATPATGNYIYLTSEFGEFVGDGKTATYTQANADLVVEAEGSTRHLTVRIAGNQNWRGDFQAMSTLGRLQPGYYADLRRYPFHNPAKGGLDWSGDGRGCNVLSGWFVIDAITFSGDAIASVDARFEQHCEGLPPALHGQIHWVAGDPTKPPGPQVPPPAGLWTPPAGATPASGNYVYLQSEAADFIGKGLTYLYQPSATTPITVQLAPRSGLATVEVGTPSGTWSGEFQAMDSIPRLAAGYYGNLRRFPFHNPALGGLSWSSMGAGCNMLSGWFVIESISYMGDTLASLDLRFEQFCDGSPSALHGKIHWIK